MIVTMKSQRERILLVETDPERIEIISQQTLKSMGFHVQVARSASAAIQEIDRFTPDVIIADLKLPGLSGKDLLVALSSQGIDIPVIVIAQRGMEGDIIQAFRLGATDYLLWPMREAEIASAVERVFKQVRASRERENLAFQLKQTNQKLQQRVRELTTIFAIGKAVTSITNPRELFEKIIEGAIYVTEADIGWLLLRADKDRPFLLTAQRNLPARLAAKINQVWDDGLSSIVAISGESLSIHGVPIKRFKISQLGNSALVVPIKAKNEVMGLLVVLKKAPDPFSPSNKSLLEAMSDYAAISLVNARLFHTLEERANALKRAVESAQTSERHKDEFIKNIQRKLGPAFEEAFEAINNLRIGEQDSQKQKEALNSAVLHLSEVSQIIETIETSQLDV